MSERAGVLGQHIKNCSVAIFSTFSLRLGTRLCWANKNLMSGCAAPTLKRVGGGRMENMYQEMVYYNRMHVKTRLSQSILSNIVYP